MLIADFQEQVALTSELLTNRTFTFRSEAANITISETFLLHPNGMIVGYGHPNERYWDIRDNQLFILDYIGNPTCKMTLRSGSDSNLVLSGAFLNPANEYEETGVIHSLTDNRSDYHKKIQSFDLFDTLVARHCYDPLTVFKNLETKYGIPNFAEKRHKLEMSIFGQRTYGLDDIYKLLIDDGVITIQQADVLKTMELQEEWDMLFPIAEVLALVGPDDIIISDMYLPQAFVERVLREKCGLDNKLYLSNYGKHSRVIWPTLADKHQIRTHYGDNWHADITGASEAGIAPVHVQASKWLPAEEIFHKMGLGIYAHELRRLRLECHHNDPIIANTLKLQATLNVPLLLLGSLWLLQLSRDGQIDRILTCARDSNLLNDIVNSKHFARYGMPISNYINISRTTCYASSPTYEAYFRSQLGERNLLVDVVGTGKSLNTFIESLVLQHRVQTCVLVADPKTTTYYPQTKHMMLKEFKTHRFALELLNASLEGSTYAAICDDGPIEIQKLPVEFSEDFLKVIDLSRALSDKFIAALDRLPPVKQLPNAATLEQVAGALVDIIPAQIEKFFPLIPELKDNRKLAAEQAGTA